MEVNLEIHVPGLDMAQRRWTRHLIFMEEVHTKQREIAALAWKHYEEKGRGTLTVGRKQWIQVIREAVEPTPDAFPCGYVQDGEAAEHFDFGALLVGFEHMLSTYDPEMYFVLTVEHHQEDFMSAYLIHPDVGPRAAFKAEQAT